MDAMATTRVNPAASIPGVSRAFLVLAGLVAVVFWLAAAAPYLTLHKETFGRFPEQFWDRRHGLWIHILGGTVALLVGLVQLWLGQSRQRLGLHRMLGKSYLAGVAITCSAAYYLAFTTTAGFAYSAGLFGMSLAATLATTMAYRAIVYRNFDQHREWMIRSYVAIFSFVSFRVLIVGLEMLGVGGGGVDGNLMRLTASAWISWALPLLMTECALQWPKVRRER